MPVSLVWLRDIKNGRMGRGVFYILLVSFFLPFNNTAAVNELYLYSGYHA